MYSRKAVLWKIVVFLQFRSAKQLALNVTSSMKRHPYDVIWYPVTCSARLNAGKQYTVPYEIYALTDRAVRFIRHCDMCTVM